MDLLLQKDIQEYITAHLEADCSKLALQKNPFPTCSWVHIIQQIQSKQKCKSKLPTWYATPNLIYPAKLSVEQSSSEITAAYKASLVQGNSLIDLTGGMGVDDYYFSQKVNQLTHCELSSELSASVQHNFDVFGISNVNFVVGDSLTYLENTNQQFDWIYIDPSRRNDVKGKVFLLDDCLPNVPQALELLFAYSPNILVKTAPLLDLNSGIQALQFVKEIHIIAVENEVKELLWLLDLSAKAPIQLRCMHFSKNGNEQVDFEWNAQVDCSYSIPLDYVYEPNSAIMKSGQFQAVAYQFGVKKLHEHSHLYTHNKLIPFPGRVFKIDACIPYNKEGMKQLALNQANISTRNFPDAVETIRKKWKIKDGGDLYCFFTTNKDNQKIVLLCSKLK
ncbi:MAG: class I SAM-dependent methyltransferase [Flavobacterium sp.]|nr:class I SAM-dependent methyltransferase [Flavobacterium sp.]